jgi:ArsR family transcriptional regulator, lead/cadmium/zinc/bismuth-responsive transcriptional repressor
MDRARLQSVGARPTLFPARMSKVVRLTQMRGVRNSSSGASASSTPTSQVGATEARCGRAEHAARKPRKPLASDEAFERAAAIFRAASDVSRLKLLERLADGEWCVTELAEAAGTGLSTVSQQLRLLRAERIVSRRRAGKHIYYALADAHVRDLILNALEHAAERGSADSDE